MDQFYTKEHIAKECIKQIKDLLSYDLIVEPSAGTGSFSNNIENCIAYDLDPKHPSIIKKSWFDVNEVDSEKFLVIGNPPFGNRSKLAKDFIKHAIQLQATTIAFVLPKTFNKYSNQTLFPENWRLESIYELSRDSFIHNDKDKHVPCNFYVWTKKEGKINIRKPSYKIKNSKIIINDIEIDKDVDFLFLKRGDKNADFSINGNSGKIKKLEDITNGKSEHYIKTLNIDKNVLIKRFKELTFVFPSSIEGENGWIGRQEILETYYEKY